MSSRPARACRPLQHGFTLIEVMIVLALVAILAAIALPSYQRYVNKSRAKGAASDLMSLGMVMENRFQKSLQYPVYETATTIAAKDADRSGTVKTHFSSWIPAQAAFFSYTVESAKDSYTVKAVGSGALSGCTLSLTHANARNAASDCSILGAW